MIVLGLDFGLVNYYLVLYVIFSIVTLVYGTNKVYATGETRGVIFAIGTLLVLIYFGLRWFGTPGSNKPRKWPPVINMCPDYLTYVPSIPGCVDMLGVSKNGNLARSMPSDIATLNATNSQKVFKYTSTDVKAASGPTDLQRICDSCQNAGVTWEGVYDGDSCLGISTAAADNEAKAACLISI